MRFRPTVRLRLTLLYGGLFLAAGAVLLGLNYALVRSSLGDQTRFGVRVEGPAFSPEAIAGQPVPAPPVGSDVLVGPGGEAVVEVLRAYRESLRDQALHELVVQSSLALGVMAVGSVGLGWVVAGRALRPLQQVTGAARRLSKDNLHERLALQGPQDELKELADTFDAMLERLEAAFESQKRFVANASHELRTPLAIQRTLVDVALADPATTPEELRTMAVAVRDAVDRSERLIESLLVLTRAEQGDPGREPVDLADVAEEATATVAVAGRAELRLDPAPVVANRVLVERLVGNLVDNAVRHGDGRWLHVSTGTQDGTAYVRVANSGPSIAPAEVDGLFQPFRRLGQERTGYDRGMGLGLSIVRAVAAAHGGSARAAPAEGGGLDVIVSLPLAPSPIRVLAPAAVGASR